MKVQRATYEPEFSLGEDSDEDKGRAAVRAMKTNIYICVITWLLTSNSRKSSGKHNPCAFIRNTSDKWGVEKNHS